LTTHNLAALFDALDLAQSLSLDDLARRTFTWICRRERTRVKDWHAQLTRVKNAAYAWRQMIFFLAHLDAPAVAAFIAFAEAHLKAQGSEVETRLRPALTGLSMVASGGRFGSDGIDAATGGRRLLGWSVGRHWMLEPR